MNSEQLQVGVMLPTSEPVVLAAPSPVKALHDFASRAHRLGFDSLWAGESLQRVRLEPLTVLAALTSCTGAMSLGTAAFMPTFRQPVATAQAIATLDRLTEGRLILGVGAGYPSPQTRTALELVGVDYQRRYRLLDDIVDLWSAMWSGADSYDGSMLHVQGLPQVEPHSPTGPPVWLAANSSRMSARFDGWLPYPPSAADYGDGLRASELRRPREQRGQLTPALFVTVCLADTEQQAQTDLDEFCRASYGLPASVVGAIQLLAGGTEGDVVDRIAPHVSAGARHLVVRIGRLDPSGQLDRLHDVATSLRNHLAPDRHQPQQQGGRNDA